METEENVRNLVVSGLGDKSIFAFCIGIFVSSIHCVFVAPFGAQGKCSNGSKIEDDNKKARCHTFHIHVHDRKTQEIFLAILILINIDKHIFFM
jgi:hypothetical protein